MRDSKSNKWNASQIVAHNMTKARELRGMSQADVADRMARHTESKWTSTSVAQAEGSVAGQRIRAFTAVELYALARTFNLPVLYFLAPPGRDSEISLDMPDVPPDAWEYQVVLTTGHHGNAEALGHQYADYAHAIRSPVRIEDHDAQGVSNYLTAHRESEVPLDPTNVLAAAMHGLTVRGMRGAPHKGPTLDEIINVIDKLSYAFTALRNYDPASFVDPTALRDLSSDRAQDE